MISSSVLRRYVRGRTACVTHLLVGRLLHHGVCAHGAGPSRLHPAGVHSGQGWHGCCWLAGLASKWRQFACGGAAIGTGFRWGVCLVCRGSCGGSFCSSVWRAGPCLAAGIAQQLSHPTEMQCSVSARHQQGAYSIASRAPLSIAMRSCCSPFLLVQQSSS